MKEASFIVNDTLRDQICLNLQNFAVRHENRKNARQAAVAIAVADVAFGADVYGLPHYDRRQPDAGRSRSDLREGPRCGEDKKP